MKSKILLGVMAAAVAVWSAGSVHAALAYSFEAPPINPDGFAANGGGTTVSQSTTGVTHGLSSLSISQVAGQTFSGALTGVVAPTISDPPGVQSILFDLTIASGQEFTGGFAVIGVTIFGFQPPGNFGLQAQFADFEHIGGKAAGTYPVQIDLTSATHPATLQGGQSFNDIFGQPGGPNDLIPTGFYLYINKSNDQALTVYVDNVRTVVPEPGSLALAGLAGLAIVAVRRRVR